MRRAVNTNLQSHRRPARARRRYLLISLGIHAGLFALALSLVGRFDPAEPDVSAGKIFVRIGAPAAQPEAAAQEPSPAPAGAPEPVKKETAPKKVAPQPETIPAPEPAESPSDQAPTESASGESTEGRKVAEPLADAEPVLSPVGAETSPAHLAGDGGGAPRPPYPRWARERGWEGRIVLELEIRTDGSVGKVNVLEGTGHARLDDYTVDWAREELRFTPAKIGAKAVSTYYRLALRYDLKDA